MVACVLQTIVSMPMNLTALFSAALKHYRERADVSQEELAAIAGLDRTYISQLERGLKSPTLTTLEKLASRLDVKPEYLLQMPRGTGPRCPDDYHVREQGQISVSRGRVRGELPADTITRAVDVAHGLIDDLYAVDLDVAAVLGLRNLSAFIGELLAAAMVQVTDGLLRANPHIDGYPDLLLLDSYGRRHWNRLESRVDEKASFSPFQGGGIEVKATCGSVPSPKDCRRRGIERPDMGDTRIEVMTRYDWKAHHRETNNLVGVLWDFLERRPRIVAVFYSPEMKEEDWRKLVQPREGGGKTTSMSDMKRTGIEKMYQGWVCVLKEGGYSEFLNRRNHADLIPT